MVQQVKPKRTNSVSNIKHEAWQTTLGQAAEYYNVDRSKLSLAIYNDSAGPRPINVIGKVPIFNVIDIENWVKKIGQDNLHLILNKAARDYYEKRKEKLSAKKPKKKLSFNATISAFMPRKATA